MISEEKQENPLNPNKIRIDTFDEMLKKYDFKTYLEMHPEERIRRELDPMSRVGQDIKTKPDR